MKNSWTCASFSSSAANFSGLVACGANQGLIAATSAAQPPVVAVPGEEGVQRQLAAVHRALVDDHQIELVIMSSGFAMASAMLSAQPPVPGLPLPCADATPGCGVPASSTHASTEPLSNRST